MQSTCDLAAAVFPPIGPAAQTPRGTSGQNRSLVFRFAYNPSRVSEFRLILLMFCERMYVSPTESFIQIFISRNVWEGRTALVSLEAEILRSSMRERVAWRTRDVQVFNLNVDRILI